MEVGRALETVIMPAESPTTSPVAPAQFVEGVRAHGPIERHRGNALDGFVDDGSEHVISKYRGPQSLVYDR